MNQLQTLLLQNYASGDYASLIDSGPELDVETYLANEGGDTLLTFLFRELADDGGTTKEEYLDRLQVAVDDIQHIMDVIAAS